MLDLTQLHRRIAIGTPLGEDTLVLKNAQITERLGGMFQIEAVMGAADPNIDFSKIVGQNVTLRLALNDSKERYWNGYVSQFTQQGISGNLPLYRATIVPWIWFLSRTADFRAFQHKSVPDIIKQIFKETGYTDFTDALAGTYKPWEYCVQYRETDFNFLSRLMEQEGIYFFFEHDDGKHHLVLADSLSAHQPYPGYEKAVFSSDATAARTMGGEFVFDWSIDHQVTPGAYETSDYDFKNPKKMLKGIAKNPDKSAAADWSIYDYPGEFDETGEGDHYARVRLEEMQAHREVVSADSNVKGLATGYLFTLTDAPRDDQNREYLVISTTYHLSSADFGTGDGSGGESDFSCHFSAIDAKTPYRPARVTPKPVIQGPQTAVVVGPTGEEIYTDEYGRAKVKFHWDRYSKADEDSSCWIRVSQNWAGKKWGGMFLPRIGQEVIVEFLDGDPDLPIITGRVYNGDNKTPYPLPANSTRSGIKTLSSKGGGEFNEIRFEDKKGSEQLFVHAAKDQDVRVKNDAKEFIGRDRHLVVTNNQLELVKGDKHAEVKGDHNEKVGGTMSLNVGQNLEEKVGMNHGFEAGMEIHLKAGMNVVIEAGLMLTLKAGSNSVVIGPAGVSITGMPMVMINSGGSAGSGAGASPTSPQPAKEADDAEAGQKEDPAQAGPPVKPVSYSSSALVLKYAADSGAPFCEKCEAARKAAAGE